MSILPRSRPAFTGNMLAPKWTRGDKDGIGTSAERACNLWYTLSQGTVTEVYFPTIDTPQIRDLQFLIADGTFFRDGRRGLTFEYECIGHGDPTRPDAARGAPGYRITSSSQNPPYTVVQEILAASDVPCLLISVRVSSHDAALLRRLRVYVLVAPHLEGHGLGNSGFVAQTPRGQLLLAHRGSTWLAVGASVPFARGSTGFVGVNDGWTDLNANQRMTWEFDSAENGNVALIGELDLSAGPEFLLGLAFGSGDLQSEATAARVALTEALSRPFRATKGRSHYCDFLDGWAQSAAKVWNPAKGVTGDNDHLYRLSRNILLAHQDKLSAGASIASLSIPWGETRGDQDSGYHLVWPRDMCHCANALLAAGYTDAAQRALVFLSCAQQNGGRFYQNFFLDGKPYWTGVQLDQIAAPIMLAYRLDAATALGQFDPLPTTLSAAGALVSLGPKTAQERWEEADGYSPSTLAAQITAIVCAAVLARRRLPAAEAEVIAGFLEKYADFLEQSLDKWTGTQRGRLIPEVQDHYVRISNRERPDPTPDDPSGAWVRVANRVNEQGSELWLEARDLVDAGFLELVRYGVRAANDPRVVRSLQVVDALLRVDFAGTPCWKRYNEDGYGQYADGRAYDGRGRGGPWPILTGERGHYELAAGRDARPFIKALEQFAIGTGLLPEQLWDLPDLPAAHMIRGEPSGAAVPLAWAHAEYVKLARSCSDGAVFERVPEVYDRYANPKTPRPAPPPEFWNFQRPVQRIDRTRSRTLRIALPAPFRLHWSGDGWQTTRDTASAPVPRLGVHFADVNLVGLPGPLVFTFYWPNVDRWEGHDFTVTLG